MKNNTYRFCGFVVLTSLLSSCAAPILLASGALSYTGKKMLDAKSDQQSSPAQLMAVPTGVNQLIYAETADQYFEIGRNYQHKQNIEMAIAAYQRALVKNGDHVDSLSNLASVYAAQGKLQLAIPLFERAVAVMPTARSYSNLGYAYYLNQQYPEATRVLNQAVALEPAYQPAVKNLELVAANTRADKALTEKSADYVVVSSRVAAEDVAIAPLPKPVEKPVMSQVLQAEDTQGLVKKADAVYELRPMVTAQTMRVVADDTVRLSVNSGGVSLKQADQLLNTDSGIMLTSRDHYLQIVNANGTRGLASQLATKLTAYGVTRTTVRDGKSFNIAQTQIQYKTGFREDAVALHHLLTIKPPLYKNDQLPDHVSIKLVLGKDLSS